MVRKSYLESKKQHKFKAQTPQHFLRVKDEKGEVYFRAFNTPQKETFFNLPKIYKNDWYTIEPAGWELSEVKPIQKPNFKAKPFSRTPKDLQIQINPNLKGGTPARIFPNKKLIELSPDFFQLKEYQQKFILLHEISHFFYIDEAQTDANALYYFIYDEGFNFSQAIDTLENILNTSPEKIKRIENLFLKASKK